jgi:hypothetical protein
MKFEREFLGLAFTWLKCRWRVMQGDALIDCPIPFDLAYDFLGCNDSEGEMRLLCAEVAGLLGKRSLGRMFP